MYLTYQASYPDASGDNSYSTVSESDIPTLLSDLDSAKDLEAAEYKNIYEDDGNGGQLSVLVNRDDATDKYYYDFFTPDAQDIPLMSLGLYFPDDGQAYMDLATSQNPDIDFNANPELLPPFCIDFQLVQMYSFTIDSI